MNDPKYLAGLEAAAGICKEFEASLARNDFCEPGEDDPIALFQLAASRIRALAVQSQPQIKRECCAPGCEWIGFTDRMLGSIGPLCPDCGEVTEPTGPESQPQEVQPVAIPESAILERTNYHFMPADPEYGTVDDFELFESNIECDGCVPVLIVRADAVKAYDPAALTAAGFASVEDLLAAWQDAQEDLKGKVVLSNEAYRELVDNLTPRHNAGIAAAPAPEPKP